MPRRSLRAFSTVMIVTGALLVSDAVVTVAWQEPVTAVWTNIRQDELRGDLEALQRSAPTGLELRALRAIPAGRQRFALLARMLRRVSSDGSPVGRIRIRSLGVDFVVVNGTSSSALQSGPGIYSWAGFPGGPGTVAMAGHRTTYLAPFRRIDALRRGDDVEVDMPYGRFIYRVQGSRIVSPSQVQVLRDVGYDRLVLTACTPLYSAAQRIVVFARLASSTPIGASVA